jgi:phosphotransferase system HPr (HPr) family protein
VTDSTAVRRELDITSPAGLHARPAADFAATAARFAADIRVHKQGREADAKSVLLLLTLDVRQGDRVVVTADGPDAAAAVSALTALVDPDGR